MILIRIWIGILSILLLLLQLHPLRTDRRSKKLQTKSNANPYHARKRTVACVVREPGQIRGMELIPVIFFWESSEISHRYRENLYRTNQLSFKALLFV